MINVQSPPAPLFRDPIYDGAADPTIVYNHLEKCWWILYTNRRANMRLPGKAFMHGTDIGIAESKDGGRTWLYRGAIDIQYGRGRNTFWAPEVIFYEGEYHMYVSFVPGVPQDWNADRYILYYKSKNLWDWEFVCKLELSSNKVIDACVFHMPDGTFRMWYKDEADHSYIYVAESTNLKDWKILGPALTDRPQEGPNVFWWKGKYWMITDPWCGLGVYSSEDATVWHRQENILDKPGKREDDGQIGHHADVLVIDDETAYIFYFTHPEGMEGTEEFWKDNRYWRTSLQVAKLEYVDGKIVCDRDEEFDFYLPDLF